MRNFGILNEAYAILVKWVWFRLFEATYTNSFSFVVTNRISIFTLAFLATSVASLYHRHHLLF